MTGGAEIASQTTAAFGALKASLNGITDAATAQSPLPKLQETQAQVEKIGSLATQLPAAGRSAPATMVTMTLPTVNELSDKVVAIPGVAPILNQPIDAMRANLATPAKAPA